MNSKYIKYIASKPAPCSKV